MNSRARGWSSAWLALRSFLSGRRFVRNPMYIGAGLTLAGAALFYESLSIFVYTGLFFLITDLFVVLYEEPTLRRTFRP
jgi:protein-S-isoprenylcysteine O-methyltransferase Ste14